jgi:hypothetical protein
MVGIVLFFGNNPVYNNANNSSMNLFEISCIMFKFSSNDIFDNMFV